MQEDNTNSLFNLEDELLNTKIPDFADDETAGLLQTQSTKSKENPKIDDEFDRLLDDFIQEQSENLKDTEIETLEALKNNKPLSGEIRNEEEALNNLYDEERQLYEAYRNFTSAILSMAEQNPEIEAPNFTFEAKLLYPRFRPSRGKIMNADIVSGWEFLLTAQATRLASLSAQASDEELLNFAEKCTDENLQLAIISYVEILIEMEGCEINYYMRKAKHDKKKIERQIYMDHLARQEKIKKYIDAIRKKDFPVDAEKLVNNYFKTSKKDPDGARKILETNPATYAPIQVDKLKPRFFGMIKPKPEDGIRINRELGDFFKNLKI